MPSFHVYPVLAGFVLLLGATAEAASRPNIVVLIADDLGYGELGCQGNPQIPTPHIDSLADDGVRFTNGYVTAAFCSASRAGFITGRYQTRFGYEFNPIGAKNEDPTIGLPAAETTFVARLADAGYATGLVGKWHLGGTAAYHPLRKGFQEFFGFLHEGHYFVPPPYDGVTTMLRRKALPNGGEGRWIRDDGRLVLSTHMGHAEPAYDANNPILRDGQPVVEHGYLTDAFTREAVSFIDRNADRPFCLCVAYNAVHSPLQARDEEMQRLTDIDDMHRRIFAGMLLRLDDSVGEVLAALERNELAEQTLVFFFSDNGGPTKELTSSNAPLRGGKGDVYEGGVRVPFLARWTGTWPQGVVDDRAVISLDIAATSMAVAGIERAGSWKPLDGVNLHPYLTKERANLPHETLYWRTGAKRALRHGDWKVVRQTRSRDGGGWELYDLSQDIEEQHDLAGEHAARLEDLVRRWEALDEEMVQPLWR